MLRDHVWSVFGHCPRAGDFKSTKSSTTNLLKLFDFTSQSSFAKMTVLVFETVFAVPMTCQSCINDIEGSLQQLSGTSAVGYRQYVRASADHDIGIHKVSANLEDQLVSVEGTAPPSAIVEAIQSTGRDAILRGSGKSDSEYAILRFQCWRLTSIFRRCSVHLGITRCPYREQGSRIGTDGRSSTWDVHHRFEHSRTVAWDLSRHCARKW